MALEADCELGQHRLVEKIGEGGMGVAWRARDTSLNRDVATRILPENLARDGGFLARFGRGSSGRIQGSERCAPTEWQQAAPRQ